MSRDRRLHPRTRFESRVRVDHPEKGSAVFRTGDVSDGGLYLKKGEISLEVGEDLGVQILDVPVEAPVVRARVVRADAGGYGLEFID